MTSNLTNPTSSTSPSPSSRTRRGKIARLPAAIRDELNRRLDDGESGAKLISWLNGLPEVQKILADEFSGVPLSEQNLSQWKQGGGFADWQRLQEARALARSFIDDFNGMKEVTGEHSLPCALTAPLALLLGRWLSAVSGALANLPPEDLAKEGHLLLPISRELANLRRVEQRELHLRLERERWDTEQRRIAEEKAKEEEEEREWEESRPERERELPAFIAAMTAQLSKPGQDPRSPAPPSNT